MKLDEGERRISDGSEWTRSEEGHIQFVPMQGYSTATLPDDKIIVRIECLNLADISDPIVLQVGIANEQAKEFIESLKQAVQASEMGTAPTDSKH